MPVECESELDNLYCASKLSAYTFSACGYVAECTEPLASEGLIVLEEYPGGVPKLMYMSRPTKKQWLLLERGNVIRALNGSLLFLVSSLH